MKKIIEKLKLYVEKSRDEWKAILNEKYKTDSGTELTQYAKGRLEAYIELLSEINAYEKKL